MNGYVSVESAWSEVSVAVYADDLRRLVRFAEEHGWRPREAATILWSPHAHSSGEVSACDALTLAAALEGAMVGFRQAAEADPGPADDWEEFVRQMAAIAGSGPFRIVVEQF